MLKLSVTGAGEMVDCDLSIGSARLAGLTSGLGLAGPVCKTELELEVIVTLGDCVMDDILLKNGIN